MSQPITHEQIIEMERGLGARPSSAQVGQFRKTVMRHLWEEEREERGKMDDRHVGGDRNNNVFEMYVSRDGTGGTRMATYGYSTKAEMEIGAVRLLQGSRKLVLSGSTGRANPKGTGIPAIPLLSNDPKRARYFEAFKKLEAKHGDKKMATKKAAPAKKATKKRASKKASAPVPGMPLLPAASNLVVASPVGSRAREREWGEVYSAIRRARAKAEKAVKLLTEAKATGGFATPGKKADALAAVRDTVGALEEARKATRGDTAMVKMVNRTAEALSKRIAKAGYWQQVVDSGPSAPARKAPKKKAAKKSAPKKAAKKKASKKKASKKKAAKKTPKKSGSGRKRKVAKKRASRSAEYICFPASSAVKGAKPKKGRKGKSKGTSKKSAKKSAKKAKPAAKKAAKKTAAPKKPKKAKKSKTVEPLALPGRLPRVVGPHKGSARCTKCGTIHLLREHWSHKEGHLTQATKESYVCKRGGFCQFTKLRELSTGRGKEASEARELLTKAQRSENAALARWLGKR